MSGSDPKGDRSIVRFENNERVDLPDLTALQDNSRSETRMLFHNFMFGHGGMGYANDPTTPTGWTALRSTVKTTLSTILTSGLPDSVTNHSKGGLANYVAVSFVGPVITVNVKWLTEQFASEGGPETGGFTGVTLDDGTIEQGVTTGCEGDDSQTLDITGQPVGDYGIYFSATYDAAEPGARLFWDGNSEVEVAQSMDTRKIPGWNASYSLLSGGAPSDAHQLIQVFHWDGAIVTQGSTWQNNIFEGVTLAINPFLYASGWGEDGSVGSDPYGMRSNSRLNNGVACWQDWSAAIRAQLRDIIGPVPGDTFYNWYTTLPEFTGAGGGSAWAGERSSLSHSKQHIETITDPHGALLTQNSLTMTNGLQTDGQITTVSLNAGSMTIKAPLGGATDGVVIDGPMIKKGGDIIMGVGGSNRYIKTFNPDATPAETWTDATTIYAALGATCWLPGNEGTPGLNLYTLSDLGYEFGGAARQGGTAWYYNSATQTQFSRLHCPLNASVFGPAMWNGAGNNPLPIRIMRIYWNFYSNPLWAGGTYALAARTRVKKKDGAITTFQCQEWNTVESLNMSQGLNGIVGDIDQPPGAGDAPVAGVMDLTAQPDADWSFSTYLEEWELQCELRGDGIAATSPFFVGVWIEARLGRIL